MSTKLCYINLGDMMKIKLINTMKDMYLIELCKINHFSKDLIKKLKHSYDMYETVKKDEEKEILLPNEDTTVKENEGQLDIVYEDDYLLIVNKESNLSTIPSKRHYLDNLSSRVKAYLKKGGIHIITRLDKLTSGLVLIAKHQYIQGLFQKRNIIIEKKYIAKVDKDFPYKEILVEKNISRVDDSMLRCVDENGDYAKTLFKTIEKEKDHTVVEAILYTGRTHQIRVHLQYIGHPCVGDKIYGNRKQELTQLGQMLSAIKLSFIHPLTNERMTCTCDIDDEFKSVLQKIKEQHL